MKNIIPLTMFCLVAIAALAQEKADIIVSYECVSPNSNNSMKPMTSKMSLMASPAEAMWFNELSLWIDSLQSTPEGKSQYEEILKKSCMTIESDGSVTWNLNKGPFKHIFTYVFSNLANKDLTIYDKFGEDQGYYTESIDEIQWTIDEDSTKSVMGYECAMAESDYHGRRWKAWFTPEIPVPFGPWKLRRLPGLILEADADGGFSFTATGIEGTDRIITPMYIKDDYTMVDRLKALDNAEYYKNNKESILRAQGQNVEIYITDDYGNKVAVPKYDGLKHSLEPDYKMKK